MCDIGTALRFQLTYADIIIITQFIYSNFPWRVQQQEPTRPRRSPGIQQESDRLRFSSCCSCQQGLGEGTAPGRCGKLSLTAPLVTPCDSSCLVQAVHICAILCTSVHQGNRLRLAVATQLANDLNFNVETASVSRGAALSAKKMLARCCAASLAREGSWGKEQSLNMQN